MQETKNRILVEEEEQEKQGKMLIQEQKMEMVEMEKQEREV